MIEFNCTVGILYKTKNLLKETRLEKNKKIHEFV